MKNLSALLVVFAVLLQLFAYYTLIKKIEPFMYQFYIFAWWSYIILIDGILALKTGRHLVLNRRVPYLVAMSAAFWCLFELLNVRLLNWFYINVTDQPAIRFPGYFLAFGTVIPAIYLTKELLCRFLPEVRIRRVSVGAYRLYAAPAGLACLALCLAFPAYFFGLAWGFLALLVDGVNYRRGGTSLARDLENGSLTQILASGLAGMICGFLWEFWNYWSVTKWVYTVPFFEDLKLFEMPALGYIGFALFGLETIAFVNLLEESPYLGRSRVRTSLLALFFALASFLLIDRYTVFSHTAPVDRLFFLTEGTREALESKGVETSYAIDPRMLNEGERRSLALMHLKGLGLENLQKLQEQGVDTIEDLAGLDQDQLSRMIGESNMRRVRVYLKAARRAAGRPFGAGLVSGGLHGAATQTGEHTLLYDSRIPQSIWDAILGQPSTLAEHGIAPDPTLLFPLTIDGGRSVRRP